MQEPAWTKEPDAGTKRILIGTQYMAEKSTHGGKRIMDRDENGQFTARYQNDTNGEDFSRTRDRIASENGASSTVTRVEQYLDGIEAAEEAVPGISGEGKP